MLNPFIPAVRIGHYLEHAISTTAVEKTGVWFPQYQIYKNGQAVTDVRTSLIEPLKSADLAIDFAFDLAREDIRLGMFDSEP